mmetsp:Transcript_18447/g.47300  ORF Transcript_18447/g.47300 Transcript_18447/m.47300 type:complete len:178 (-) Transcript_18447:715-1248(-)
MLAACGMYLQHPTCALQIQDGFLTQIDADLGPRGRTPTRNGHTQAEGECLLNVCALAPDGVCAPYAAALRLHYATYHLHGQKRTDSMPIGDGSSAGSRNFDKPISGEISGEATKDGRRTMMDLEDSSRSFLAGLPMSSCSGIGEKRDGLLRRRNTSIARRTMASWCTSYAWLERICA